MAFEVIGSHSTYKGKPLKDTSELIGTYVDGITNDDYHADKSFFSSSQLKKAIDSPYEFLHKVLISPEQLDRSQMDNALDWGTLVHCLVLEPHMFDKEFAIMSTVDEDGKKRDFRKKEHKDFKKEFIEENKGKLILTDKALAKAKKAIKNVKAYPLSNLMMTVAGRPELSGYFKESTTGLLLRFRPDKLIDGNSEAIRELNKLLERDSDSSFIIDVKTTQNISKQAFKKDAKYKFNYDLSAHMYLQGHKEVTGEEIKDFYFLCIQNSYPFSVAVYKASDELLSEGKVKYEKALNNTMIALDSKQKKKTLNYQTVVQEI